MRILILYSQAPTAQRITISQHLRALEHADHDFSIVYHNIWEEGAAGPMQFGQPRRIPSHLRRQRFDAAILHYTFLACHWDALKLFSFKEAYRWVRDLPCLKAAMPQDEADHADLLDEWLFEWGIDIVFSVLEQPNSDLYPLTRRYADIIPCLTGYIDEVLAQEIHGRLTPLAERPLDLVYRARRLPYRYGTAGLIKAQIGEQMAKFAAGTVIKTDISTREADVIFGSAWIGFLASSKATLGCESGFTVIDRRGELKAREAELLAAAPDMSFASFTAAMPDGWDEHHLYTVSPRHFEAAQTLTCQILIEGRYADIFVSDRHFIPLKADFSNAAEVLVKLRDPGYLADMVQTTYDEIVLSGLYSYRSFANQIHAALAARLSRPNALRRDDAREAAMQAVGERHSNELAAIMLEQRLRLWQAYRIESDKSIATAETALSYHHSSLDYINADIGTIGVSMATDSRLTEFREAVNAFQTQMSETERVCDELRAISLQPVTETLAALDRAIEHLQIRLHLLTQQCDDLTAERVALLAGYAAVMQLATAQAD
jgi:hypothetical protein